MDEKSNALLLSVGIDYTGATAPHALVPIYGIRGLTLGQLGPLHWATAPHALVPIYGNKRHTLGQLGHLLRLLLPTHWSPLSLFTENASLQLDS